MHPTAVKLSERLSDQGLEVMVLCAGDRRVETVVDESLHRFATVWCAAGTPQAVFEVTVAALLEAIPDASVQEVSE